MKFSKYQHVENIRPDDDNVEVKGLLDGTVYIQTKMDGTNTTVWLDDDGKVAVGKRSCEMGEGSDNAGSKAYILSHPEYAEILKAHPHWRLCGEWMVRHTIKTYKNNVWNKFYIFDVIDEINGDTQNYLKPEHYMPELDKYGLDYVPVLKIIKEPTFEQLKDIAYDNTSEFTEDGVKEGIVCKNYEYNNPYGRRTWGKIVQTVFKDNAHGKNGYDKSHPLEEKIVEEYLTKEFCLKEYDKALEGHNGEFSPYLIPEILGRIKFEFVRDEMITIIKKYHSPTINFKVLFSIIADKAKQYLDL